MKPVLSGDVLDATSGDNSSRSQTSGSTGTQNWPRPPSIKLTVSGVALSAAQTKSPSFSRSSASTTTTTAPRAIASTAAGTLENESETRGWSGFMIVGCPRTYLSVL